MNGYLMKSLKRKGLNNWNKRMHEQAPMTKIAILNFKGGTGKTTPQQLISLML